MPIAKSARSRSLIESFGHAFSGMWHMLSTQRNAWVHAVATVCAVTVGIWLSLSTLEWAILALAIGSVWITECINTALEAAVDLASPDVHPLARVSKDVGAAAVLAAATVSVIIGLLILGPPLWSRLRP